MTATTTTSRESSQRVGLVLGGGGLVGQAYHAGTLAALEHDLGWDARSAEVVVGTSAGAVCGALLRAGVRASELAAWTVEARVAPETTRAFADVTRRPGLDPLRWAELLRPRVPRPSLVRDIAFGPRPSATASALTLLRDGSRDIEAQLGFLDGLFGATWSPEALWITAVARSSGRRVTFGSPDGPTASVRAAVAASCAVPGYFKPVCINSDDFIDGGAHSPTNADVLADVASALDIVIVLSPMSYSGELPRGLGAVMRRLCRRSLTREVALLEHAGTEVVMLEPSVDTIDAMGADFMSDEVLTDVVRASFLSTGRQINDRARRLLERRLQRA